MTTALWTIGLIAVGLVLIHRWLMNKGTDKFWAMMRDLNAQHGTAFGTCRADVDTVIGTNSLYGIMAFDPTNRKIAYITKSGKSVEILDYSIIHAWTLRWSENTYAGGVMAGFVGFGSTNTSQHNAVLEIETNDYRRPLIKLRMPSMRYAEHARARLRALVNG